MSGSVLWLFLRFPILFVVDPKMETRWVAAPSQNDPASSRGNQQPAYSVSLFCHGRMGREEDRECESGPPFFSLMYVSVKICEAYMISLVVIAWPAIGFAVLRKLPLHFALGSYFAFCSPPVFCFLWGAAR
jgi:hypothetical protein